MWEWTGPIEGDRFSSFALANTDSGAYASPDAFTELVASAFAVRAGTRARATADRPGNPDGAVTRRQSVAAGPGFA